jgi:sugar/nucleoside kinase (ribokinase family)
VLGRDTFAEFAKRFADAEGMPCRWQIRDDQPTSTSSITVNAKAENQIAMIFGANEHLDPASCARRTICLPARRPCDPTRKQSRALAAASTWAYATD